MSGVVVRTRSDNGVLSAAASVLVVLVVVFAMAIDGFVRIWSTMGFTWVIPLEIT
jgi:hypothetical protein